MTPGSSSRSYRDTGELSVPGGTGGEPTANTREGGSRRQSDGHFPPGTRTLQRGFNGEDAGAVGQEWRSTGGGGETPAGQLSA